MGKRQRFQGCSKQGLYKANRRRRHIEAEARAMLLGGKYNRHSRCIIVETKDINGDWPTQWVEYYDQMGAKLTRNEYFEKVRLANEIRGPEKVPTYRSSDFSPSFWNDKVQAQFGKSTALANATLDKADQLRADVDSHILDSLQHVTIELPPEVTPEEVKDERSEVRTASRSDVRGPRSSDFHIRGPRRQDSGRY